MKAVEVEGLTKRFGDFEALRGCSFNVDEGEVFGLIGPNGAGKTTTLRIIATLLRPTSGSVKVFGLDVERRADEVRRMISYLPEEAGAYGNLSGEEYLRFIASFYSEDVEEMVEEGRRISGLGERLTDRIKTYSRGMVRRLLLARTLMTSPRLAILDEPTSGLDVIYAYEVRRLIKDYAEERGTTILLSSHNMLEVEYLCDRVALIDGGVIIEEGSPGELRERDGAENLKEGFMEATGRG